VLKKLWCCLLLLFCQAENQVACNSGFFTPDMPDSYFDSENIFSTISNESNRQQFISSSTSYFFQLPLDCYGEIRSIESCFVIINSGAGTAATIKYAIHNRVGSTFTEVRSITLTRAQVLSRNQNQKICSTSETENYVICCPLITSSAQVQYSSSTFLSVEVIQSDMNLQLLRSNIPTNLTSCNFAMGNLSSDECSNSVQNFPFIFRLRIEPGTHLDGFNFTSILCLLKTNTTRTSNLAIFWTHGT